MTVLLECLVLYEIIRVTLYLACSNIVNGSNVYCSEGGVHLLPVHPHGPISDCMKAACR